MVVSWLVASLLLNLVASAVVLAMGFLVLRKHPASHFRWWVTASAWRVAAAAFGTVMAISPTQPVAALLTAVTMCLNGSANYLSARRYLGGKAGRWVAWWPLLCLVVGIPWVLLTDGLPSLVLLPPFLILAGGYWAMALALWRGQPQGVGARFSSIYAACFAIHSLAFPFVMTFDGIWGVPMTIASMLMHVALSMALIVALLEASMVAERRSASAVRDVGEKLSATAFALSESRALAEVAATHARQQEALVRQIVHDLRNATQAMGFIAEELEAEAQGRPKEMALVAALDRQLLFVSTFLRQKLAWIADRHREEEPTTNASETLWALAGRLAPVLASKGQHLQLSPPPADMPFLRMDGVALDQVLSNLVLNAHQHGPPGLVVQLRVAVSEGWATFVVQDDGPGLPLEVQARLGQVQDRKDGTGQGLGIVQEVVTQAGGRWGVLSEEGQGSTFHVALPLVTWGAVPKAMAVKEALGERSHESMGE